ncbi:MAG: DUF4190 domain-containing protein [Hungatella sp.]|nr:DUF4190 domain-containing protein [Hungatella sp.]
MDEHTNTNPETDSNQTSQEQQQNGQGNPPEQQNSQEQPQFQQYLNQEQVQQQQNPYQQSGQYRQQDPYQQQNPYQQPGQYQQQDPYQQSPYQQSPYQQNQYQQNSYQQIQPKQSNGMALASMIMGIFALLTCCIPFIQFPLAVIAIVLVILSKKGRPFHGFAIAGLVMAIISVLVSIGMTFYWGYVIKLMNDPEFMSMYNEIMEMYQ